MRVECWGGPLHGRYVEVKTLPFLVPIPVTLTPWDFWLDPLRPSFKVGRYDTAWGDRRRVYYEGP